MAKKTALVNKFGVAYRSLIPTLGQLVGYRVTFLDEAKLPRGKHFGLSSDGDLYYSLLPNQEDDPVGTLEIDGPPGATTSQLESRYVSSLVHNVGSIRDFSSPICSKPHTTRRGFSCTFKKIPTAASSSGQRGVTVLGREDGRPLCYVQ
jgi:hypothetical protein